MANIKELGKYIEAGYSLFYCEDKDYNRVLTTVRGMAENYGSVFTWVPHRINCEYWRKEEDYSVKVANSDSIQQTFNENAVNSQLSPTALLGLMSSPWEQGEYLGSSLPKQSIIVALLFDEFLTDPANIAKCIEGITTGKWALYSRQLIVVTPSMKMDARLREYAISLEFSPYTDKDLNDIITGVQGEIACSASTAKHLWIRDKNCTEKVKEQLQGMPLYEVPTALRLAVRYAPAIKHMNEVYGHINTRKSEIVKRSDVLTLLPEERQVDPKYIGGFDNFLEYMRGKAFAFSDEAKKLKIDPPKGVVLLGVPGTGKSMAAKSLGFITNKPVVQMDMSSVFGALVGESESRVRQALKTVDAIQGCVLLIDEADKAFAGGTGSSGDSGTTQRVLGTILNWLQEQSSDTFVIITMNRIDSVPPEFLRPGRFDKIFYTDVPLASERRDILEAHLLKRGVKINLTEDEWLLLQNASDGFTGAELEEVVKDARLSAYRARGAGGKAVPTFDELLNECKTRVPMVEFDKERVDKIRQVCASRATPVSKLRLNREHSKMDAPSRKSFNIDDTFFEEN